MSGKVEHNMLRAVLTAASITGTLISASASAAPVIGHYEGMIHASNFPGVAPNTTLLQVDFVYDDAATPDNNVGGIADYTSFLQGLSVTVGANTWTWDSANGSAWLSIYDNYSGMAGQDVVLLYVETFNGPALVPDAHAYTFSLSLYDQEPLASPDGVTAAAPLPSTAPDADDFQPWVAYENNMNFSFLVGDPETGDRYAVVASNITNAVPEPATNVLILAGLGIVAGASRRIARKR